ncbi:4-hydroxybenzoate 3-monooxygenase [Candidatus Rhodobacter oscarellae]|nr:4-hydroxybenzoate 3-monooxygenase [Candidatus Rhodobacter lobularis]
MRTQVAIIGGGPSGLLLSQILNQAGVETVVLERATREHVLGRIRAGVLESGTVATLRAAGLGDRLDREGFYHEGCFLTDGDLSIPIELDKLTGRGVTVYGQTEVTRDLYEAQDAMGTTIVHGVEDVVIQEATGTAPFVEYTLKGARHRLDCDYVAGCDGFHGVSRKTIPEDKRQEFERVYPFGWLGVLSKTPPVSHEVMYSNSPRGFGLCSMRNAELSRYYIQVPVGTDPNAWSDDQFWEELSLRLPKETADRLVTGPSVEKSVAPLRSFVSEPLRWGRLFLVGDAAHIVPPTGAKGLNLAVSDVYYLSEALIDALKSGNETGIDGYSDRALNRIWKAMRFSWSMTTMLHQFEGESPFEAQMRRATLNHLSRSETARKDLAENYIGLPY